MTRLLISVIGAAAILFLGFPFSRLAWSQALMCGNRDEMLAILKKNSEQPVFTGLSLQGAMTQLWYSPEKRGYSVITIPPKGNVVCVLDIGGDGDLQAPKPGNPT